MTKTTAEDQALLNCETGAPALDAESFGATTDGRALVPKARRFLGLRVFGCAVAIIAFAGAVCIGFTSSGRRRFSVGGAFSWLSEDKDKPLTPWMGEHDMARLYELMSKATYYREFGSGGSTVQAVSFKNLKKIVSTESDEAWVKEIKERDDVAEALKSKRLVLEHGDVGPVKIWGYPKDTSAKAKWPAYSNINNSHAEFNPPFHFDFIFVDGRFRVACLLKALKTITPERRKTTWLAMHDYLGKRNDYHIVEQFAKRVDFSYPDDINQKWIDKAHHDVFTDNPGDDVLGIFQMRSDIDEDKLNAAISKYIWHKH